MLNRRGSLVAAITLVALSIACGGGSGGQDTPAARDGDTLHLTVSPLPVGMDVWEHQSGVEAYATVTVRPRPTSDVWVEVVDPDGVLDASSKITVEKLGGGAYGAYLPLATARVPGVYEGTFTLRLCKSPDCSAEWRLDGASIPYRVPIARTPSAEILVDGSAAPGVLPTFEYSGERTYLVMGFRSGQRLAIRASEPVTWSSASRDATLDEKARTSTAYEVTIVTTGIYGSSASIWGTTAGGRRVSVEVSIPQL